MKHLDLFSGIGGFALAARNVGWETVAFCEPDAYCQAVLRKHWPNVPIHNDVRELTADAVGSVDIITGGYPCQPFSLAGKRGGAGDDRHLWPQFARLIRELRPRWVVGENVAGHITLGLDNMLSDLEGLGYAWEAFVIPAVAVDARHRRDRLWVVAHPGSERRQQDARGAHGDESANEGRAETQADELASGRQGSRARVVADANRSRLPDDRWSSANERVDGDGATDRSSWRSGEHALWSPEPDVGRVAHGIPRRVDRLRALGNAIVPQVAEEIFRAIEATR